MVFLESEVHIMIFRFAADTKSAGLKRREEDSNKFTEGRRIENCDPLCGASGNVVRIHSSSWYRSFSFATYFIDPKERSQIDSIALSLRRHFTYQSIANT